MKTSKEFFKLAFFLTLVISSSAYTQNAEWNDLNKQVISLYQSGQYDQALLVAKKMLEITERELGSDHRAVATILNNLAEVYHVKGEYAEAESLHIRALAIREKALGSDHPNVAQSLNNLAALYKTQSQYVKAEPIYQRSLAVYEQALGPDHPDVARSLNNLAELYRMQGQYTKAESLYQRSLAVFEQALGSDHLDVAMSLNNLALLYQSMDLYAKAEPLFMRSLAIFEKAFGSDHLNVALSLNNLGMLYQSQGQHTKAESLHMRSLEILEKVLGSDHPDVTHSLNNLAEVYHSKEKYAEAELLLIRALAIREKALGPNHPHVALSLNNLAELYRTQGQYKKAEPLYQRSLAVYEQALGSDHPDVAMSLNNLALLYQSQGQYAEAESLYERALLIRERIFGLDHSDVAISLNSIADFYIIQGQYAKAEPLLVRALGIVEQTLGLDHFLVAHILSSFAELYSKQSQYVKAELFHIRALSIREKIFGMDHSFVATSLNNLAALYQSQSQYTKAESLYIRALSVFEKALGSDHPDVSASLSNLGALYQSQGQYAKAEQLFVRALTVFEKALGPEHPDVALGLSNISVNSWSLGDMIAALAALQRSIAIREHHLELFLTKGSEEEKRAYMATIAADPHAAISLQQAADPGNLAATRLALTTLLQRKGRILDAISADITSLRERLNEQDRMLLDQLAAIRNQQSSLYNQARHGKIASELYHKELARLTAEAQNLEAKISSHSAEFKTKVQPITLAGIQQAIPKDAALVEFAVYRPFNPKAQKEINKWGAARYIAYVLKPHGDPLSVELGDVAAMDRSISVLRNALSDSKSGSDLVMLLARRLDEQLMQPVRKLLGDTKTVFLSPDGGLNLLPFDALVDENDQYLIEKYNFTYLSSGRDLLRLQTKIQSQDPGVIIGDVNFGYISQKTEVDCQGPGVIIGKVNFGDTSNRSQTTEVNSRILNRRSSDFVSETFLPLPCTAVEAREISKILPVAKVLMGKEATEGAIKKINSPRILHVATHGFFLPDRKEDLRDTRTIQVMDDIVQMPLTENPLLRSGLALANANLLESAGEDGVLTALETSGLNLWGTQLVVLSACETGLGEVQNGEGVFGLRRALVIAGSESQLMTLWKVDDLATKDLMVDYYRRLVAKEGRSAALRQAQLDMLSNPDRQHPYYWASFIASGDWRQLD